MKLTRFAFQTLATFLCLAIASVARADVDWTGGGASGVKYWDDSANWSGTAAHEAHRFHYSSLKGSPQTVTFRSAEVLESSLWVENGIDGVITFTADSTNCGLCQTNNYNANIGTGTYGALAIDGGRYHFANDIVLGLGQWSNNARGDLTVSGGRVETEYWMVLGSFWDSWHAGASGNVTVEGGELVVGCRKNGDGNYVESGNALIEMGRAASSVTTFTVSGGAVSSESNGGSGQPALIIANGENSTATFTISGGSYTARAGNVLMANGAGTTGILNLEGGTFTAEAIAKGSGSATVNFNGGTLAATAGGTLVASGVAVYVDENGGCINPNGYDVVIDGDITGVGSLTIVGHGSVTVNGSVTLSNGALSLDPSAYYTSGSDYDLALSAASVSASAISGVGTISTTGGVTAGGGSFYGKISGAGGLTVNGELRLYGLCDYAGTLTIGASGALTIVSSLGDISPLWRLDASDAGTISTTDGKVTQWNLAGGGGYFANADSAMVQTDAYFGGRNSVLTSRSTLTSSWSNDGNAAKTYHTQAIIGAVRVVDHSNAYELLLKYNGVNSSYIGRRSAASGWDRWTKMRGSGNSDDNGFWQNGTYGDLAYHDYEEVLEMLGYGRNSSATSISIGGGAGSVAVGELMAFHYDPSHQVRRQIETYLANKWGITAMGRSIPSVPVVMAAGSTLDLGGLDLAVAAFSGAGTVKGGTLRTAGSVYYQGAGKLSVPAVDGATYVASSSDCRLEIADAAGKSVTVRIPANWLNENAGKYSYIYCDGTVAFDFEGEPLAYTDMGDGRYRFGTSGSDIDFGEYGENTEDDANEELLDDDEPGLAFPGAKGWGRFAKGARASSSPTVYHVTSLADSGSGTLRDAVSRPNRIVVFDVSGVIRISSRVTFASNLYVAGQTAPGEGITVYGNGCSFSGASNIICRYLRWRMGHGGSSGKDCAGIANGANMIFDHCSFSWGLDETFSINPDGKGTPPSNITLQNCIFGQGLMTHSAGGLMQGDYITLYRNLYVDNSTRNNKVKGINHYANNIVYNWKNGCYIMGGDSSGSSHCIIEGNLFVNGPVSASSNALGGGNSDFHFYGIDNWQDFDRDGVLDPTCIDGTQTGGGDKVATRYDYPVVPLYAGNTLLENNLRKVGASLPYRDRSDCYMIDEVKSVGRSGGLITYEDSLAIGAPDTWDWWPGTARTDSDGDGMPDAWEDANGLDKNLRSDALAKTLDGTRLNIEVYINSITAEDRQYFLRAPVTLRAASATTTTITLSWRDYTYGEKGFSIEMLVDGVWVQKGIAGPNETSYTVGGLTPGTYYSFQVLAVGENNGSTAYSDPATLYACTRAEETAEVDIDTYEPDYTLAPDQGLWDKKYRYWVERSVYSDGNGDSKVLLDSDGNQTVTISIDVAPESIVANGTGTVTLKRVGWLTGAASIHKGNSGTLVLCADPGKKDSAATYTGKVVNHGGTIEFDSIANGGAASALGASTSDSLNWVFDGGTYRYTGGTASTDRSATFRQASVLDIANSGTTLTMTGAMEGSGEFILDGAGTLNIPDANTFFGNNTRGATIRGGTLYLSTTGDSGSARNFANRNTITRLTLAGGHVSFASANEEYQTYNVPIYAEDGTSSTLTLASHCYMKSRLAGNGDITFNISHVRSVISSNMSDYTGRITANGVQTSSGYRPSFYHSSYWNYPSTRFNLTGKISMASKDRHARCHIGGLSGESGATLSGSDTKSSGSGTVWYVGYANSDEEFAGAIDDYNSDRSAKGTTSVVKVGTGLWRLTGASSHSGTTTVDDGALIVNGSLPSSSMVTVNSGGTLQGKGSIYGSVTVASGGTLRAGDTIKSADVNVDSSTWLYMDAGVTMQSGSRAVIPVARNASGSLVWSRLRPKTGSSFTIESGVTLEFDLSEVDKLSANEKIYVFALVPSFSGAFDSIEPATPGRGLKWDTSRLYTDKYVSIVKDTDYVPDMTPSTNDVIATVAAVSELDAYNALDVAVPSVSWLSLDVDTYKSYFDYKYTDNGNGTFDVEIVGIADDVRRETLESAVDALVNQEADSDGFIGIAVRPGLYYGMTSAGEPGIAAPPRYLSGGDTWKVAKPAGSSGFIRIDIAPFQ